MYEQKRPLYNVKNDTSEFAIFFNVHTQKMLHLHFKSLGSERFFNYYSAKHIQFIKNVSKDFFGHNLSHNLLV